ARRDHLRPRAARDVPAGQGKHLRPGVDLRCHLWRRVPPERGRAVALQLRTLRHQDAVSAFLGLRDRGEAPDRGAVRAARLRDGHEVLAHLQPARCARCDLGHRARGLHPVARAARLSDAQERAATGLAMKATLLVEILTEELPPKSLRALSQAFFENLSKALASAHLAGEGKGRAFATPRRLAVLIPEVE